jgi:hypothetical protein
MVESLLTRAYRKLGPRYPRTAVVLQIQLGYVVWLATVALISSYVELSGPEFVRLFLFGLAFFIPHNIIYGRIAKNLLDPVVSWIRADRSDPATEAAWRAAAALPWDLLLMLAARPTRLSPALAPRRPLPWGCRTLSAVAPLGDD